MQYLQPKSSSVYPGVATNHWEYLISTDLTGSTVDLENLYFNSSSKSPALVASDRWDSYSPSTNLDEASFSSLPMTDFIFDHSITTYADSVTSETWPAEATSATIDMPENPGDSKAMDRYLRRREQNRKAQINFRQKRREEVRRLERKILVFRPSLTG